MKTALSFVAVALLILSMSFVSSPFTIEESVIKGSYPIDLDKLYIVLDADHGHIKQLYFKEWNSTRDITPVEDLDSSRPFSAIASGYDEHHILGAQTSVVSRLINETSDRIVIECKNSQAKIVYSFYKAQQFFDVEAVGFQIWSYVMRYSYVPEAYATNIEVGNWTEKQVLVTEPWVAVKRENLTVATCWNVITDNANYVTLDSTETVPLPPGATAQGVDIGDLWHVSSLIPAGVSLNIRIGTYFSSDLWYEPARKQFEQYAAEHSLNFTTHEGDLIINGTQTFVIENCTFAETGSVSARDYSKLVIKNAVLFLNQPRGPEFEISAADQASMEVENALITSPFWFGIGVGGEAKASMNFSTTSYMTLYGYENGQIQIINSTVGEVCPMGSSNLTLVDSAFVSGAAVSFLFGPPNILSLSTLKPDHYGYWNLHANQTVVDVPFDLTFRDVTVQSWNLELVHDVEASISDSSINAIFLHYYNTTTEIRDILPRFYSDYVLGQIKIENSSVQSWVLRLEDTVASVVNSTVDVTCVGNSDISTWNTTMTLRYYRFTGRILFNETICTGIFDSVYSSSYMQGDVKSEMRGIGWWISSNVTRNYNVIAKNVSGDFMENVALSLFDKSSKLVWDGTTDSLGQANFNLTFTDSNYTNTLRLGAVRGNYSISENITFLSDTPVIIQLTRPTSSGDVNGDKIVDIYDAILLANAYNSKPNDPNWNVNADINGDNVVDIYDAILLANNYGKTA